MTNNSCDDSEWVEEEHLVLVELTGVLNNQYFANSGKECKILGVETENPVLQVGNYVFKGEYKNTVGTAVFFEKEEGKPEQWKYKCSTDKMLNMKRVFLQAKDGTSDQPMTSTDEAPIEIAGTIKLKGDPNP